MDVLLRLLSHECDWSTIYFTERVQIVSKPTNIGHKHVTRHCIQAHLLPFFDHAPGRVTNRFVQHPFIISYSKRLNSCPKIKIEDQLVEHSPREFFEVLAIAGVVDCG